MEKQLIISVGREFGSGGHEVAQKLADDYGIALYDHDLLKEIARMYFVFAACLTRLVYNIRLFSKMQALFSKKSYFFTGSFHSTKTAAQTGCIHPLHQIQTPHTSAEPSH